MIAGIRRDHKAYSSAIVLLALAAAFFAVWHRFVQLMPTVFYGDDLKLLLYFMDRDCATTASAVLTQVCQERFRPVASGTVLVLMNLFGDDMRSYQVFNVGVHVLSGLAVYGVGFHLARSRIVAALLAVAFMLSRFGAFQTTHAIGPVESLALLLTLLVLYCLLRAEQDDSPTWKWCWAAVAFAFVAAHAHERYLVVATWLMVAFVAMPRVRSLGLWRVALLVSASALIPIFYISYKTAILDTHFLIGTAETHIEFDPGLIREYAKQTALTVFGFNSGPEYLVGRSVDMQWPAAFAAATVFMLSWSLILLGALALTARRANRWMQLLDAWCWPVLLAGLAAALVAPTLVTVRLELRWFLGTFACVLLLAAWAIGRMDSRRLGVLSALVLCSSSVFLDSLLLRTFDTMSLFWLPQQAAMIKRDVADKDRSTEGLVFVTRDMGLCDWGLWRGDFFRVYGGHRREIICVNSIDAVLDANLSPGFRVYSEQRGQMIDVTSQVEAALAEHSASRFDFLAEFEHGAINDERKVDTPTGRGALVMPWESPTGPRNSLTLLSGFRYRYDDIDIPSAAQLVFDASMTFAAPQPARLVVKVIDGKQAEDQVVSLDLVPPQPGHSLQPAREQIDLSAYEGKRISIEFSVESPGGDSTAHWIAIFTPRIVVR